MPVVDQDYLLKTFRYCPRLGRLYYRNKTQFVKAGQRAGTVDKGYRRISIGGKKYYEHHLVWVLHGNAFPTGVIDHINHNKLCNRYDNLREVSHSDNSKNLSKMSHNSSGTAGVHFCNTKKRWIAKITVDGKRKHIGAFTDKNVAISARHAAQNQYNFHENHGK